MKKLLFFSLISVAIAACSSNAKTSDSSSLSSIPSQFADSSQVDSLYSLSWKDFFSDSILLSLLDSATKNNLNLKKTSEQILVHKSHVRRSTRALLPEVNIGIAGSERKFGDYTMDGAGNEDFNLAGVLPNDRKLPTPYTDYYGLLQFSWEIDVVGKLRNQRKAEKARFAASLAYLNLNKTIVISTVSDLYVQLLAFEEQKKVLQKNISLQEKALELSYDLKKAGKTNELAVEQFKAQLLESQYILNTIDMHIRNLEYSLNNTLSRFDQNIPRGTLNNFLKQSAALQTGVPTQLLQNRPDIKQAEYKLIASKADVKAAKAAFFPTINLYGNTGFNAFNLEKLLVNPASFVYHIGLGLTTPLFNRNHISAMYDIAQAEQRIALYEYEETVLRAYFDVLSCINEIQAYDRQIEIKNQEVEIQTSSVENSRQLFLAGYATYLEIINAQRLLLESEMDLIETQKNQKQASIKLFRALGGGWLN